jgi:two-component system, sensor histidine kinase and response regulator
MSISEQQYNQLIATYYCNTRNNLFNCSQSFLDLLQIENTNGKEYKQFISTLVSLNKHSVELENFLQHSIIKIFSCQVSVVANKETFLFNHTVEVFERDENKKASIFSGTLELMNVEKIQIKTKLEESRELNKKLAELNVQKDKIFSIVSHDLKSPISQLKMFLEVMLTNKQLYGFTDEQIQLLSIVQANVEGTYNLLNNLLTWSSTQIKKIKLHATVINIADIIQSSIKNVQIAASNKQVEFLVNTPSILLKADAILIETVFRNIIGNAIKFSIVGSVVQIQAHKKDEHVIVVIKDTGVGIVEENITTILNSTNNYTTIGTNREKGTGLGFNLAVEFIKLHDGNLQIESQLNHGTTVIISLPIGTIN